MSSSHQVNLTAQCLCKTHTFTTPISPADLPLNAIVCHCASCRHLTGALYTSDCPWPGPTSEILSSTLKRYAVSPRINALFCGTCSSPMFSEWKKDPADKKYSYGVCTGVLKNDYLVGEGKLVVRIAEHCFVGDTIDGGASVWLRRPHGELAEPAKLWLGRRGSSEEVPWPKRWPALDELPASRAQVGVEEGRKGDVPVRCHCGGVDLVYKAGDAQKEFRVAKEEGRDLGELYPLVVDPETHKGLGSFDACDSCRLSVGADILHWTFPYLRHIAFADGSEFPKTTIELREAVDKEKGAREHMLGTLAYYVSSPDVQRYFCSRCSASFFYAVDEHPDLVDLAVGVLHAPDGARAESIISWNFTDRMVYRADMLNGWRESLLKSGEKEADEWRAERGYPKCWRRVQREKEEAEKAAKEVAENEKGDKAE